VVFAGWTWHQFDVVFVFDHVWVCHWIYNVYTNSVAVKLFDDVCHFGVADVCNVFFEGEAHHKHASAKKR